MRGLVALLLAFSAPAFADAPAYAPGAPADARAFAFDQHPGASVPIDTPLRTDSGAPATLRGLAAGRPILLILNYFRCPNLCGTVRDDAFRALDGMPVEALVAAVTIDPAETPADAAAARRAESPPPGAAFLSGDATRIAEAVGFPTRWIEAERQFLHPAGVVLLTPDGRVSSYLLGVGYTPDQLAQAIRTAAADSIAQRASPILLLCFHYDPVTGRYTPAITRILQLAAGLTVAGIVATLGVAHLRSRV